MSNGVSRCQQGRGEMTQKKMKVVSNNPVPIDTGIIGGGVSYFAYRVIRMIPSLLCPPSIIPNAIIPQEGKQNMFKYIHDNIIIKYIIDFENGNIVIYTLSENGEKINIIFEGILAYLFENQQKNNIILDIEEKDREKFITDNNELLERQRNFGWPIMYKDMEDLKLVLEVNRYNYYVLNSSCGMNGWIVAKKMKVIQV